MNVVTVLDLIKKDDIKSALASTKTLLKRTERGAEALLILHELQLHCRKTSNTVDFMTVYNVANECCMTLARDFKTVEELKFSTYLHFILKALLQFDLQLCETLIEYLFVLKRVKSISRWKPEVSIVFSHVIAGSTTRLENYFSHETFTHWFSFASKMYKLDPSQSISRLICGFSSCLFKFTELAPLHKALNKLSDWLCNLSDANVSDKDVTFFLSFVHNSLGLVWKLSGGISQLSVLRSSFDHFRNKIAKPRADLELFSHFLCLVSASDVSSVETVLRTISNSLTRLSVIPQETVVTIAKLLHKSTSQLKLPWLKEINLSELFKITLKLYKMCSKSKESFCFLHFSLTVFHTKSPIASDLTEMHALLKKTFEYSCTERFDLRHSAESLASCLGKTLLAYNKCQLDSHTAVLSILTLKFLHKLQSNLLNESDLLKWWTERVLGLVASSNAKSGSLENALIALVAFSSVHKDFTQQTFNAWAEAKTMIEGDDVGQVTVHDVVQKHKYVLETEWNPFRASEIDVSLMLMFELQAYLKKRGSRNKPVLGVYKTAVRYYRESLTIVPILTATIDSLTTESGVAELGNLESSLSNVINHLKNLFKNETDTEKLALLKCLLGSVYYVKLRFEITRLRKTMENRVLANKNDEIPVLQIGTESEDTDSSKVNPEFDFLALSKQEPIMKLMQTTTKYWRDSEEGMAADVLLKSTLGYMKGMAYLYRLQCYTELEEETWKLLFRVASKQSCRKYQLLAVAELLSVSRTVDDKLLERAKTICENQEQGVDQNSYVYQQFYINYAKNLFLNKKISDCETYISKVEQISGKGFLVNVQLTIVKYLVGGLKINPCIIENFRQMLYVVKKNKWNTFNELSVIQWLFLELTYYLGSIFCDLRAIRHARSFVIQTLTLAKQLVLPLRTCRLLHVLGLSDAICSDTSECEIKLSGIGTILELETLLNGVDLNNSCEILSRSVCKPQFIHHGENCVCLLCANVECQILSLDTVYLKIACSTNKEQKDVVENLIEDGLKVIEIFEKNRKKHVFTSMEESKTRFFAAVTKYFMINKDIKQSLAFLERAMQSATSDPVSPPLRAFLRALKRSIECIQYKRNKPRPLSRKKDVRSGATVVTPERKPPQASVNAPPDARLASLTDAKGLPPVTPKVPSYRRKILAAYHNSSEEPKRVESTKTPNGKDDRGLLAVTPITYPGDLPLNSAFKTPMVSKSKRKGPTEKKVDFFRTPVLNKLGTKPKSCIQIFCDDEDITVSTSQDGTVSENSVHSSSVAGEKLKLKAPARTYKTPRKQRSRRHARVLSSSDSEEDDGLKTPFDDKTSQATKIPTVIIEDDDSVIEGTPPEKQRAASGSKSSIKKPIQQESVEGQFERLSITSIKTDCGRTTRSRRKLT